MPIPKFFYVFIFDVVQLIFDFTLSGVSCNIYYPLFLPYSKLSIFELLEFLITCDLIDWTILSKFGEHFFVALNGELIYNTGWGNTLDEFPDIVLLFCLDSKVDRKSNDLLLSLIIWTTAF